jgi:hypothetical protein
MGKVCLLFFPVGESMNVTLVQSTVWTDQGGGAEHRRVVQSARHAAR